MKLIPYSRHRRTRVHVDLNAPPHKRWAEAGTLLRDSIQEAVEEVVLSVEEHYTTFSGNWSTPFRAAVNLLLHPVVEVPVWLARVLGQEYPNEIRGLATAAGVPFSHLFLANLMYDITQVGECLFPQACSSYSTTVAGHPTLVRNMDWAYPESIGRHTVVVEYHKRGKSYTSVGVAGLVGVLSAMSPGNWAVTLNQAPVGKVGVRYFEIPALQRLRQACDQFGSYRKLVGRIQEYRTMSPFFAHVVGIKPTEQAVINGFGDSYVERTLDKEPFLVQTNHYVGEESEESNPSVWLEETDTLQRSDAIKRRLKRRRPANLKAAWEIMKRFPVTHENTMQSMVLCPATNSLRLKVRV